MQCRTNRIANPTRQFLSRLVPPVFGVDADDSIVPVEGQHSDALALQIGNQMHEISFGPVQILVLRLSLLWQRRPLGVFTHELRQMWAVKSTWTNESTAQISFWHFARVYTHLGAHGYC